MRWALFPPPSLRRIRDSVLSGRVCEEYSDHLLMRDVYHCPPSLYDEQDERRIEIDKVIYFAEKEREYKERKRSEQRIRMKQ